MKFSKIVFFLGFFFLAVFLISLLEFTYFTSAVNSSSMENIAVVIPKGKSVRWIGDFLKEKGLIRSSALFRFTVWRKHLISKIQAGSFQLQQSQSLLEIIQTLTKGTSDVWVTIPEGLRREEIAEVFGKALDESFDVDMFLTETEDKEGYLFPETYLVPKSATSGAISALMERTFNQHVKEEFLKELTQQGRTLESAVILASLIEREANNADDMKIVSGILLKRKQNNWPLQVDATLQYSKGYDTKKESWWVPPTANDKTVDSPFNTYANPGFPPLTYCKPRACGTEGRCISARNFLLVLSNRKRRKHAVCRNS